MKKNFKIKTICYLFSLFMIHNSLFTATVSAAYVLPYPSYMPGHKLYSIRQIWEKFQEYWSFGNLAQFKYHLKMADKYLVEAKTLFEYEQYLLAVHALNKSNNHWQQIPVFLEQAAEEGKDVSQQKEIFIAAVIKHQELLSQLVRELPEAILWQPEKQAAEELKIHQLLDQAKNIREKI